MTRPSPSAQRSLGQIVLGFEFIIVLLGALVMFGLKALSAPVALGGGAALAVAMLATIGLLRYRWGYAVGWVLQAIVIASGFFLAAMFVVGAIFTGIWAYCMITGERLDRANARAREGAAAQQSAEPDSSTDNETHHTEGNP